MKIASVKLSWTKSPSADVRSVKMVVNNGGTETTTVFGPEVEEAMIDVAASSSVSFKVVTTDSEGLEATSALYTFNMGDLVAPQPATNLFHEVVGVRDEPDA